MKKQEPTSERIISRYLERINEVVVDEIVVTFANSDLEKYGISIAKSKAGKLQELMESSIWKKYDNKHDIRFDNRPQNQGGPQLHVKNRQGIEWAFLQNGGKSERNKYTTPSTRDVRNLVRDYFKLGPDIIIESNFIGILEDQKQLLLEIRLS